MEKYKGNKEPFIYALFSAADRDEAMETLEYLDSRNYRLTYEENGAEDCIKRSSAVMLFLSGAALTDEKLLNEVALASKYGKTVISVFLEGVKLTPGLSMMLGQTQGILKYQTDGDEFRRRLDESPVLAHLEISEQQKTAGKRRTLAGIAAVAVLAVAAVAVMVIRNFSSKGGVLLEKLGITGDLNGIKTVYVYGEELRDDYRVAQFIVDSDRFNDKVFLDGEAIDQGSIEDISDFSKLKNLEELCLSGNRIQSIEPILGLKKLKLLDVSHNYGIDLSGISKLSGLEVLNIAETEVSDYSELFNMKNLKTVYVSASSLDPIEQMGEHSFEVIPINTPVHDLQELQAALDDPDVHMVQIMNSIEIPNGVTLTVRENVVLGGHAEDDAELVVDNYGTIILYGCFEMGLCERNNYGAIIIRKGGIYTGGMCDTRTYGSFIIEEGGYQVVERGHNFVIEDEYYDNEGTVVLGGGGTFRFTDGELFNNGTFVWNLGEYGPGIYLDNGNYYNNGTIYLRDNRELEGGENPTDKEIDDDCIVISMEETGAYNPQ